MKTSHLFGLAVLALCGLLAACAASAPACAQAGAAPAGSQITLSGEDVLSAVRIGILNGIIDYVNQAKHARLAVAWEMLPVDPLLKEDAAAGLVVPQMMKIPNAMLAADNSWPRRFPQGLVEAISHDLGRSLDPDHVSAADLDRWHEKFLADWHSGAGAALALQSLVPRTYYGLLRDHNLLYFVLRGDGIGFYVDAESDQPVLGLPKVAAEGITWVVRQYPFLKDKGKDIWVYRYGISAQLDPFDIYVSNFAQEKITLSAQVGIRPSEVSVGLFTHLIALAGFDVSLEPARQEKIEKIEAGGAVKRVDAVLSLVGAPELGAIIGRGLFAGGDKTTLVSGVLASRSRLGGFVGANTDLRVIGRDARLGLLFGLNPGEGDALYAGPSLHSGALLVSVGAHVAGESAPTHGSGNGRGMRTELGGVLSLDLGGLFGARREITKLGVANAQVGGNWGISSDFIGRDLGYLQVTYTDPSAPAFEAVQVTDAQDRPVAAKSAQVIRFSPQAQVRRFFVPAGAYRLILPQGRELLEHGGRAPKRKVQVGGQVEEDYFLTVLSESPTEAVYDVR